MCKGVYHFPSLYIDGYDEPNRFYYVTDSAIHEIEITYKYVIGFENDNPVFHIVKHREPVDGFNDLICLPDPWEQPFAPEVEEGTGHSCGMTVSAYDVNGNLIAGEK